MRIILRRRIFPLFFLSIFCVILGLSVPLAAQQTMQPIGDIGAAKANEEALEKLRKMTPDEIANLDALMEKALTLYYDRKFALALPIFKDMADKIETMDILFWLGTAAAKSGEMELAIEKFKKMLAVDPNLYRVRLELASVYFAVGRHKLARKALETVRAANPPPEVQANINRMMAAIDESTRKLSWNLRLSTGFMWDDNISSGPDPGVYSLPGGSSFRPATTTAKLSDQASVTNFAGNLLFDSGEKQGLMWNTGASFYFKSYLDYSEFDYLALDVNTGPWWVSRQSIFKLPVGYTYGVYGSDRLSYNVHVDPSYEYFFKPTFSLKGTYIYQKERFYQDHRTDFDNITQIVEIAPTFYLGNRRHIISATLAYDNHTADNDIYTYDAPIAGINYFTRFANRAELYLGYQWTRRDYTYLQAFPYAGMKREDERQYFTAVLSRPFFKYFNVSYAFAYTRNDSTLKLNEWDKSTHTLSVGCQF